MIKQFSSLKSGYVLQSDDLALGTPLDILQFEDALTVLSHYQERVGTHPAVLITSTPQTLSSFYTPTQNELVQYLQLFFTLVLTEYRALVEHNFPTVFDSFPIYKMNPAFLLVQLGPLNKPSSPLSSFETVEFGRLIAMNEPTILFSIAQSHSDSDEIRVVLEEEPGFTDLLTTMSPSGEFERIWNDVWRRFFGAGSLLKTVMDYSNAI